MKPLTETLISESAYRVVGYDNKNFVPHQTNRVEILQFWSDGGYFIARNKLHPIKPGNIVMINSMELHYSNPSDVDKYNRSKLIISMDCFKQICSLCNFTKLFDELINNGSYLFQFDAKETATKQIDVLFKKASEAYVNMHNIPTAQASIINCTIELLSMLEHHAVSTVNVEPFNDIVHKMTDYINKKLVDWEDFSLDNICKELHISRSYAAHLFKDLTNKSMTQYIMDLRLTEAKKLLLTTDLKVFDIAEMLNFKDSTTFCKMFKKHVGCTPRSFRISAGNISAISSDDLDI